VVPSSSSCFFPRLCRGNECAKCSRNPIAIVIVYVVFVIIIALGGYILQKKKINIAFLSVAVDYFQVLAILIQTKIDWPSSIKQILHFLSVFNLNLEASSLWRNTVR
jgi:hypothetical protein